MPSGKLDCFHAQQKEEIWSVAASADGSRLARWPARRHPNMGRKHLEKNCVSRKSGGALRPPLRFGGMARLWRLQDMMKSRL